jgi:C1A family cysteine protease
MAKTKKLVHHFGWLPDLPDQRDFMYAAPMAVLKALPPSVDLRKGCPPVYNQLNLGSCTANALAGAFEFNLIKEGKKDFTPARLFIYYNERVLENTVNSDNGAFIRDGIKTMNKQGVCSESIWPYDVAKFAVKPPQACYANAKTNEIKSYQRLINTIAQLKGCLADGFPFVFGFTVYESFESATVAKTGKMPMPKPNEQVLGGHAVVAVGYNDKTQTIIVRNSWDKTWGDKGYFYMPYAYITDSNLCDDFWTIRLV